MHPFRLPFRLTAFVLLPVCLLLGVAPAPASAAPALLEEKRAELKAVTARVTDLQDEIDRLTQEYAQREAEVERTKETIVRVEEQITLGERDLAQKKARLAHRVVGFYKEQHSSFPVAMEALMGAEDITDALKTLPLLARIADNDKCLVKEITGLVAGLAAHERGLEHERLVLEGQLRELAAAKAQLNEVLQQASLERQALEGQVAELEAMYALVERADGYRQRWKGRVSPAVLRAAKGMAFPVDGPHGYINDWHFPRSDERVHKGTDIMAPFGTPLVAVVDGVISRTADDTELGGVIIWLNGNNGVRYYYAHLQDIAPGIAAGKRVLAGEVIGTVGDSGNAQGGAPHLHFQVHPGGGEAVNPYPLLLVSSRSP